MAITLVAGQTKQNTNSGSPVSITFTANFTAGNLVVIGLECNNNPATITISDTVNTYTSAVGPTLNGTQKIQLFYAKNVTGGVKVVTATATGATYINLVGAEFAGADTTAPLNGSGASATGTSTTPSSGNATVAVGDLVVAFAVATAGSIGLGTGYSNAGTDTFSRMEYKTAASTSEAGTFTCASGNWAAIVAAFSVSGGGGGGFTAKFRRTLSPVGTRVGSRQGY